MFQLTSKVIEGVVFANTPSYLYARVSEFLNENPLTALSDESLLEVVKATIEKSAGSVAEGYVALVGLLRRGKKLAEIQTVADLKPLMWARQVAELNARLAVSNNEFVRSVPTAAGLTRVASTNVRLGGLTSLPDHPTNRIVSPTGSAHIIFPSSQ